MSEVIKFLYQAIFSFTGTNNDELNFIKGDIIAVTQKEDGGWWEGTFDGNTGWFPSNYVKEYKAKDNEAGPELPLSPQHLEQQKEYRASVMKSIIDSERKHVTEIQNTKYKLLNSLEASNKIPIEDFRTLTGNFDDIIQIHKTLLSSLEEQAEKPSDEQIIGKVFLNIAPALQIIHSEYSTNHPKAASVLEKYKCEISNFMEQCGSKPLAFAAALSQPFRRLERYPTVLQEYQRHIEDIHPDRGNTQRSVYVYKELFAACNTIRRQKHLENEVLTNKIEGLDDALSSYGEILFMRSVALLPDNRDKYFVLFSKCLVILSLSPRASSFIFEGKYALGDFNVNRLEDNIHFKNAFELTGPRIEKITAVCQTKEMQLQWIEVLSKLTGKAEKSYSKPKNSIWRMSCLRPSPPLRPNQILKEDTKQKQTRRKEEKWHSEDTLILRVIEAYCTSNKARYTINSINFDNTQHNARDILYKIDEGSNRDSENRMLMDMVSSLKSETAVLLKNYGDLKNDFETEKRSSQHLTSIIKNYILKGRDDIPWEFHT